MGRKKEKAAPGIESGVKEKSKIGKKILAALEILFLVVMIGMCALVFMAGNGRVPYIFGYRVLQVISDSMVPTINDETCIIIKKVEMEEIQIGDIITFVSEAADIRGYLNTHRVHDIVVDESTGETLFITKGDAYAMPDLLPVQFEQVAGEYVGEFPFGEALFKGIRFLADKNNYFLIVMLPLFFCFLSYFKQFWDVITGKKKAKEDKHVEEILEELEEEEAYRRKQEAKEIKREIKKAAKSGDEEMLALLAKREASVAENAKGRTGGADNAGSNSNGNSLNKDISKFYD